MDRKILLSLVAGILILLAVMMLIPSGRTPETDPKLPWLIKVDSQGNSSVFGITPGQTTLQQAQAALQMEGKVNLFVTPDEDYFVEAYFERISLSGLKADIVLALQISQEEAQAIYQRGARQKMQESGNKKVEMASNDFAAMALKPVANITYIPATDLDEELINKRFGEPSQRVAEESGIVHWLYPDKGLDIALNPEGKEIFQYVNPAEFDQVTAPLRK